MNRFDFALFSIYELEHDSVPSKYPAPSFSTQLVVDEFNRYTTAAKAVLGTAYKLREVTRVYLAGKVGATQTDEFVYVRYFIGFSLCHYAIMCHNLFGLIEHFQSSTILPHAVHRQMRQDLHFRLQRTLQLHLSFLSKCHPQTYMHRVIEPRAAIHMAEQLLQHDKQHQNDHEFRMAMRILLEMSSSSSSCSSSEEEEEEEEEDNTAAATAASFHTLVQMAQRSILPQSCAEIEVLLRNYFYPLMLLVNEQNVVKIDDETK